MVSSLHARSGELAIGRSNANRWESAILAALVLGTWRLVTSCCSLAKNTCPFQAPTTVFHGFNQGRVKKSDAWKGLLHFPIRTEPSVRGFRS